MSNPLSDGMGWRVTISIITFFASIILIIIWLFFYAENYTIYQNVAIVVVIFLVFIAVMAATWASWGMKQSREGKWRSSSSSNKKGDFE
jgi:heme/copper-type cytochrome/quinol oxidase subunit 4